MQLHKQDPTAYLNLRKKDYYDHIYSFLKKNKVSTLLDVGGASGDFGWFAPEDINILSVDVSKDLIEIGKSRETKKNLKYLKGDILKENFGLFDAVTVFGTLGTFEDLETVLESICTHSKKHLIIHTITTPYPFDVQVKHRNYSLKEDYQSSFNIYSIEYTKDLLKKMNFSKFRYEKYIMNNFLEEGPKNKLRNFNVKINNKIKTTNQLGLIFDEIIIFAERDYLKS